MDTYSLYIGRNNDMMRLSALSQQLAFDSSEFHETPPFSTLIKLAHFYLISIVNVHAQYNT